MVVSREKSEPRSEEDNATSTDAAPVLTPSNRNSVLSKLDASFLNMIESRLGTTDSDEESALPVYDADKKMLGAPIITTYQSPPACRPDVFAALRQPHPHSPLTHRAARAVSDVVLVDDDGTACRLALEMSDTQQRVPGRRQNRTTRRACTLFKSRAICAR